MHPPDPRLTKALKEIETACQGKETAHAYYDPKNKVYILVVSGNDAEPYHNAVKAMHDLAANARKHAPAPAH